MDDAMDGAMAGDVETPEKRKLKARHPVAKFGKLGPRVLIDLDPEPEKQEQEQEQDISTVEIISSEPTQEVEQTSLVTTSPVISELEQELEQEQDQETVEQDQETVEQEQEVDQEQKLGLMDIASSEPAKEQEEQDLELERLMSLVDSKPALLEQNPYLNDLACENAFGDGLIYEPVVVDDRAPGEGRYNIAWPDGRLESRWGPGAR